MHIYSDGFDFDCPVCKIKATVGSASDVHAVKCNQTTEYFVVCPNCGIKIKIKPEKIPAHIKSYVKIKSHGIMTYHD